MTRLENLIDLRNQAALMHARLRKIELDYTYNWRLRWQRFIARDAAELVRSAQALIEELAKLENTGRPTQGRQPHGSGV